MAFNLSEWFTGSKAAPRLNQSGKPVRAKNAVTPYHAVAVKPGPGCCGSALEMKRKRFLSGEAPKLPLAGCTSGRCTCVYAHYEDRRTGTDRRMRGGAVPAERRRIGGRRASDH